MGDGTWRKKLWRKWRRRVMSLSLSADKQIIWFKKIPLPKLGYGSNEEEGCIYFVLFSKRRASMTSTK